MTDQSGSKLRAAVFLAMPIAAVGSIGFLLRAGQRAPRLLLGLLVLWVLSPYGVVGVAGVVAKRWPILTGALYVVTLVFAPGSLAVYAEDAMSPRSAQPAFVFVVVPLVSWALIAVVVPIAVLISRRRFRPRDAA